MSNMKVTKCVMAEMLIIGMEKLKTIAMKVDKKMEGNSVTATVALKVKDGGDQSRLSPRSAPLATTWTPPSMVMFSLVDKL